MSMKRTAYDLTKTAMMLALALILSIVEAWLLPRGILPIPGFKLGLANVAILDAVRVEVYGSRVPLNQVANVSVPDARTIAIKPWDRKEIRNIEKAIMDSDVGITPENNGEVIRLNIPVPTEERRRELAKQCNKIAEKAKVEVRNVRADIKDKLKKAVKDGLSEDNEKDAEQELQKIHDKYIKRIDELIAAKNKEIMTV